VPLIQKLFAIRDVQPRGIAIAFTSVGRGEGVSHVVASLGRKLTEHTFEQILLTTPAAIPDAASARYDATENSPQLQRMTRSGSFLSSPRTPQWEDLQTLRQRFGFVLVDSPALRSSSATVQVASLCDAAVLVVAAGEARRLEIEKAQKILKSSAVELLGVILNKQVDPIPEFISTIL